MRCTGLYLVRNEVDVMEVNLRHHLHTSIDEAIVVDNGSTDGTLELIIELARELPILVISETGEYRQADLTNRMAQLAISRGATWLLPIDADEFWVGVDRSLREVLVDCPEEVGVLRCEVVNLVQRRSQVVASPAGLLGLTMRVPEQRGSIEAAQDLVESAEIAFVEMRYPPKCVSRASHGIRIHTGNHDVDGVAGERALTDSIVCLHAPLRARSSLTGKLDQGRRVHELGYPPGLAWHVRRWWQLAREGKLDAEWAANSHEDGTLGFHSGPRPLTEDLGLKMLLEPWVARARVVEPSAANRLDPVVGAYLLALETVPGWFSELDFRLVVAADATQKSADVRGDILEIGAYCGKSAVLLGHLLGPGERLIVSDIFNFSIFNEHTTEENREENERWYQGFGLDDFKSQYSRFHDKLPELIVGPSSNIDRDGLAATCRLVHIDGSHVHSIVAEDIETARRLLRAGGLVVLDDISTPHNPGSAIAAWEAVLNGRLRPVCLTDSKLYGCFDDSAQKWAPAMTEWARSQPDIRVEMHKIAGYELARLIHEPRSRDRAEAQSLSALPALVEPAHPISVQAAAAYDTEFYDFAATAARSSAEEIVPILLELTGAKSVVDLGCGLGTWLSVFEQHGVEDVVGVDSDDVDIGRLEIDRAKFMVSDLENPPSLNRTFDLALSLEVAEHLSADASARFVEILVKLAPVVCFSAAIPLQGGVGHTNEQWPSYWVERFADHGFVVIDPIRSLVWSNDRVAMWYAQNLLVFANPNAIAAKPTLARALDRTRTEQMNLVHPSLFLYHRLDVPGAAATVPLDAASQYAEKTCPPAQNAGQLEAPLPAAMPLSLRPLLHQLPDAFARAARSRLGRARQGVRRRLRRP